MKPRVVLSAYVAIVVELVARLSPLLRLPRCCNPVCSKNGRLQSFRRQLRQTATHS